MTYVNNANISFEGMSGVQFEKLISSLLSKMGFEVHETKASGDGGIDPIAINDQPFL